MPYANNTDADQPEYSRSPISVFVVPCLDSIIYEPRHEKTCFCPIRTTKACSLISTFVVHSLDSIIPVVAMY